MSSAKFDCFDPTLIRFLRELTKNNQRDWFQQNKQRYENEVREPARAFIRAFAAPLKKISPMLVADDRRVGGSLMRVYRDTRFSKDKTPYKTNLGIQFRHEMGKDVHAPGLYLHLAPDECFLAAGLWRPDNKVLRQIRDAIVDEPGVWKRVRDGKKFRAEFDFAGEQLKTAPRGYDKQHAMIDDLRRTSFVVVKSLKQRDASTKGFLKKTAESFAASKPFMRYLCTAVELPF